MYWKLKKKIVIVVVVVVVVVKDVEQVVVGRHGQVRKVLKREKKYQFQYYSFRF